METPEDESNRKHRQPGRLNSICITSLSRTRHRSKIACRVTGKNNNNRYTPLAGSFEQTYHTTDRFLPRPVYNSLRHNRTDRKEILWASHGIRRRKEWLRLPGKGISSDQIYYGTIHTTIHFINLKKGLTFLQDLNIWFNALIRADPFKSSPRPKGFISFLSRVEHNRIWLFLNRNKLPRSWL